MKVPCSETEMFPNRRCEVENCNFLNSRIYVRYYEVHLLIELQKCGNYICVSLMRQNICPRIILHYQILFLYYYVIFSIVLCSYNFFFRFLQILEYWYMYFLRIFSIRDSAKSYLRKNYEIII